MAVNDKPNEMTKFDLKHDFRRPSFSILKVFDDLELDVYAYRAYARILRRANSESSEETIKSMASACNMGQPRLITAVKTLVDLNIIERIDHDDGSSSFLVNCTTEWKIKPVRK